MNKLHDHLYDDLYTSKQAVTFDGTTSSLVKLVCSISQGSVLGSLLFVLYTADVMTIALHHGVRIHAYTDDLQTCQL